MGYKLGDGLGDTMSDDEGDLAGEDLKEWKKARRAWNWTEKPSEWRRTEPRWIPLMITVQMMKPTSEKESGLG